MTFLKLHNLFTCMLVVNEVFLRKYECFHLTLILAIATFIVQHTDMNKQFMRSIICLASLIPVALFTLNVCYVTCYEINENKSYASAAQISAISSYILNTYINILNEETDKIQTTKKKG